MHLSIFLYTCTHTHTKCMHTLQPRTHTHHTCTHNTLHTHTHTNIILTPVCLHVASAFSLAVPTAWDGQTQLTWCLVYIDDTVVIGRTFEQHLSNLGTVLSRLRQAGLKLQPAKCKLCQKEVRFLGHVISENGIATDPEKTAVIATWPVPESKKNIQQFLGLANYYRRFIKDFGTTAKPLQRLLEKNIAFEWTQQCQAAFDHLRKCLMTTPILAFPDHSRHFVLETDASDTGIGAILSQVQNDGGEVVIAYASRSLSRQEQRYCVTRRELLAVVEFIHHFRHYLLGVHFTLRTDHGSLVCIQNFKEPERQLARWLERLQEYTFTVVHRPGNQHKNADALSRVPCNQCGRVTHVYSPAYLAAQIGIVSQELMFMTSSSMIRQLVRY